MARHVRTAAGARFFGKPIGSVISEGEYQAIVALRSRKNSEAPALPKLHQREGENEAQAMNRHRLASTTANAAAVPSGGGDDHAKLLEARKAARAKFPVGHPERLAAERAVRQSRKSDEYRGAKTPGSSAESSSHDNEARDSLEQHYEEMGYSPAQAKLKAAAELKTQASASPAYSPSEQHYSGSLPKDEQDVYDAARRTGKDHADAVKQVVRYRGSNPLFADRTTKMRESAATHQAPKGHGPAPDSKEAIISHLTKEHGVSESMLRRGGGEGGSSRSLKSLQASWAEWHKEHPESSATNPSAKKRSDALQKYMSSLAARGITAIPQRDANGNITSLHVPHPKKGG